VRKFLGRFSIVRLARFYAMLFAFLFRLGRFIAGTYRDPRMKELFLAQFEELVSILTRSGKLTKTTADSKAGYETLGDLDFRTLENWSGHATHGGEVRLTSYKEMRAATLVPIFREVDRLLSVKPSINILEVGCGSCLNIVALLERYGGRVKISGFDVAHNRIKVAREHFGPRLDGVDLSVQSITERTTFQDQQFDLVYSVHCLEQVAYETRAAVAEMYRLTGNTLLFIEPVFENGSPMQRLYLIVADHTRILLKAVRELGLTVTRNEVMPLQGNPANQSSELVIERGSPARDRDVGGN
jgi:ubiquinone/menaquinone biosynthesis C-methylase UbiE